MPNELEAAVAQIQEGAKAALGALGGLLEAENAAKARLEVLRSNIRAAADHLFGLQEAAKKAEEMLAESIAARSEAVKGAQEIAAKVVEAGRAEAKRLIDEVDATRQDIIAQREAAREELAQQKADTAAAHAEWNDLKARIAAAKEHFLKAASH